MKARVKNMQSYVTVWRRWVMKQKTTSEDSWYLIKITQERSAWMTLLMCIYCKCDQDFNIAKNLLLFHLHENGDNKLLRARASC